MSIGFILIGVTMSETKYDRRIVGSDASKAF